MHSPLVSIIIPTYNRAYLIGETLDSVISQIYTNWECIVVDDGSTDTTDELLEFYCKKDSRIQYHRRPEDRPKGANACRNYGFELSKGEYVNWFDSDDLMDSNFLNEKIYILSMEEEIDVVFCTCQQFFEKGDSKEFGKIFNIFSETFIEDFLLRKNFVQTGSGMWKRKSLLSLKFNEVLKQSQDYDFHARRFAIPLNYSILDRVLFFLRRENDSISSSFKNNKIEYIRSFLQVKLNILELYQDNKKIIRGIINNALSSFNQAVQRKDDLSIKEHILFFKSAKNVIPYTIIKIRLKIIYLVSLVNRNLGAGAFMMRKWYRI